MTGKRALVTGGARGIGFGIACRLAAERYDVAICDIRSEEDAKEPVAELKSCGSGDPVYYRCDISNADDRANMIAAISERWGGLNVLVNNAGVAPSVRADILEAGEESFERLMRINLQGPYFMTQAVARMMIDNIARDSSFKACVVNITSISADVASPNRGDYCVSKAGLSMASKLWAARLGEFGIPVYEIRPGIISTDMTSGVKEKYDKLIANGLLVQARWGLPEDVAKVVVMLARGEMAYSTGQIINVDGGMTVGRL